MIQTYMLHQSKSYITNAIISITAIKKTRRLPIQATNEIPTKRQIKFPTKGKQILPENLAAYSAYSCTQENSSGNPHYPFQLPAVNTDYIKQ